MSGKSYTEEEVYYKELFDSCRISQNTSEIMKHKESFWDMAMKVEEDVASKLFPVNYGKFPNGTKDMINQLFWKLGETTRTSFFKFSDLRNRNRQNAKFSDKKVANTVMDIVRNVFRSLDMPYDFMKRLRPMLLRLFWGDIDEPMLTFDDYKLLLNALPSGWNNSINMLLMNEPERKRQFDLLSSYFVCFVIKFVGDTTRILFRRPQRFWYLCEEEYDPFNTFYYSNEDWFAEGEKEDNTTFLEIPKIEPTEENLRVSEYAELPPENPTKETECPEKEAENRHNVDRHKSTFGESRDALLNSFPELLKSMKNVISQSLYDENIPDEWKKALMDIVSTTNVLESQLERAKEKFNLVESSNLDD